MTAPWQPRGSLPLLTLSVSFALVALLALLQPLRTAASKENRTSPMARLKRLTQTQGESEEAAAVGEDGAPLFAWMTPAAEGFMDDEAVLPELDSSLGALFASVMGDEGREDMEGIGSENAMIRSLMSGSMNQNFFTQGMAALGDSVEPVEAEIVWDYFPPVALMSSWQNYLTHTANTAPGDETVSAAKAEAKQGAVKELIGKLTKMALVGLNPDKIMEIVKDFTVTGETDDPILAGLLADLQQEGGDQDPMQEDDAPFGAMKNRLAMDEIQEKFLARVLGEDEEGGEGGGGGGLTMESFYDKTWLRKVKAEMAGNEAFWQILGEEEGAYFKKKLMLGEDGGEEGGYMPLKPSLFPDPETLLGKW